MAIAQLFPLQIRIQLESFGRRDLVTFQKYTRTLILAFQRKAGHGLLSIGSSEFSKSGFGPLTVLLCDQCEREYHVGCLKTHKMADLKDFDDTRASKRALIEFPTFFIVKGLRMSKTSRTVQMAKVSVGKAKASRKIRKSTKAVSISKKSLRRQGKIRRSKKPIEESTKKAGKITKKLVFGEAGLPDGTELSYFAGGKRLLDGYKKDTGIFCHCCSEVVSASQFEAHAGFASRRKPKQKFQLILRCHGGSSAAEYRLQNEQRQRRCFPKLLPYSAQVLGL